MNVGVDFMNLEYYKNFVTIVDTGTISGAAEKLLIAQPSLSGQIKTLEQTYGAPLLIRKPRHVELTDAGRILYDKVKAICALEDSAQKEIAACMVGSRGTLSLATTAIHPDPFLYQLLQDFHIAYPDITFEIIEHNSTQIAELLKNHIVEIGLMRIYSPEFRRVLTMHEKMQVYFHKEHPILRPEMDTISLTQLRNLPLAITSGMKQQFTVACQNEDFEPSFISVSSSRGLATLWAKDKITACIIAGSNAYDTGDYCCRILDSCALDTNRSFSVLRNRSLSAVAQTFLSFCCEHPLAKDWESDGTTII